MKTVQIGSVVTFVDSRGETHNAIVTNVFAPAQFIINPDINQAKYAFEHFFIDNQGERQSMMVDGPAINVVYVDRSQGSTDDYGQQLARATSIVHLGNQSAHGNYWVEYG